MPLVWLGAWSHLKWEQGAGAVSLKNQQLETSGRHCVAARKDSLGRRGVWEPVAKREGGPRAPGVWFLSCSPVLVLGAGRGGTSRNQNAEVTTV